MRSPFLLPADTDYRRDFGIVSTYINDAAMYLHLHTQKPIEDCQTWVKQQIAKGGKYELRSPKAYILDSEENGSRRKKVVSYSQYIQRVIREEKILSPSMTVYTHPSQRKSMQAAYVDDKLLVRSTAKKAMFAAKQAGNKQEQSYQNCLQTSAKIAANSLSGAYGFAGTILFNKTAHSSLTSTCRVASGNANSNNERFLAGNRHYWSVEIALNNIVNIITHSDFVAIQAVIDKYGLVYPTVNNVLGAIKGSTDYYWRSELEFDKIITLVETLSPLQRAAYLYTQDAYHLMQFNSDMMRTFISRVITPVTEPVDDPEYWLGLMDDDTLMLASRLCAGILAGTSVKALKQDAPEKYKLFAATVKNILITIQGYADLIQAFWATPNMPPSLAMFPSSMRRGAVLSDTDSTIFTVQDWTIWYRGQLDFSPESDWVAATMVYFTSWVTVHILAISSANMGVERDQLYTLAMKSEFAYPLLALTPRGKQYYSYVSAQEGNVHEKLELDIKGVGLRNSKIPPNIRKSSDALIERVLNSVIEGKKLEVVEVLRGVADEERAIMKSIYRGEPTYLSVAKVKTVDSYKNGESNATYQNYGLWEAVFAPKYGHAPEPPYDCVKVNVDADSARDMNQWLDSIEDLHVATRFRDWLNANGKSTMTQILLPTQAVNTHGLPAEIIPGINTRKLLNNLMDAHYLILESLGIYLRNKHITQLASDLY